ncbi:cytochrome-c oxidase [Halobacillus aidingensis]|uniref:Cytochrome C and Quinol oxidase polypeptide I n=1 Tax=Halobacillus aidingensis TaxID=240303 RepID=A0A1H0KU59_HALAD|nr:cytochrome-c oxidase [Halobacillus aidingensis]SDO59321.1 Cytochrome C and Quinol oxidase polypeptide I [Halobacillus aidingensis]
MGITLIKISAVYFAIGVAIGYYMSSAHDYALTPVHVHINLLGWTALTLAGILYHTFPILAKSLSGKIHFWLHNIGLPLMMLGLFFVVVFENEALLPLVATGATVTSLGIFSFVFNVLKNLKAS